MTQRNPNPNGTTNSTGWTATDSTVTITSTSAGLRIVKAAGVSGKHVLSPEMSVPTSFTGVLANLAMRRNTEASGMLEDVAGIGGGLAGTTTANSIKFRTFSSVGTFITYPWIKLSSSGTTSAVTTYQARFRLPTVAVDVTIKQANVYGLGDSDITASNALDSSDAGAIFTLADNALTVDWRADLLNDEAFSVLGVACAAANITGDAANDQISADPDVGTSPTKTMTFPSAGIYTVTVKAFKNFNDASTNTFATKDYTLSVPSGTFAAQFTSQAEYLNVTVDGSSSIAPSNDPVDVYEWDWGDGTPKTTGAQQTHSYASGGGWPVTLTTKTNETLRSSSVTHTVTTTTPPNPANYFTATRNLLTVVFSPSISGASSYSWNFGDGGTSTVQTPTYTYNSPGTYSVTLTVNGNNTTTQSITVYQSYRKLGSLNEQLRLEVAVPYAAGVVYNRLPNASGAQGAYGWSSPVSGSYITGQNTSDTADDHGIPDAKLIYHAAGTATQQMLSQAVRVTAGQYVGAQVVVPFIEGYFRIAVDALNSSGTVLGSSAMTAYNQASTSAVLTTAYQLPTNTVTARLRIEFYGTNAGAVPAAGKVMLVRNAMLATAATSAAVTGNPYISGRQWVDIIGPTTDISTGRTELDVGTFTATVLESGYDPATSGTIRPGQPMRLRARGEDGAGNVVWQPIFTGSVTNALVTYNPKRKATDHKSTSIVLSAVDAATLLAAKDQPNGVATLAELPALLEGVGVPYEVNGASGQVPTANIVAYNENAKLIDQIAVTRDTSSSYVYVSRAGVLTAVDSAHLDAAVSGVINESAYSGVDASFDTQAVINSVIIKWLRYTPASGDVEASTEEIPYGPFEDAASIDEWGFQPATFVMQGVENTTTITNKANAILAANKTPQKRIKSVSIPIRYVEDLNTGKALLDLYDLVQLGYQRTGTNIPARVVSISHKITPRRWTMDLGFTPNGATAPPQEIPSPPDAVQASAATGGTAAGTTFSPTGNIAATNVQAALAEVDSEKAPTSAGTATGTTFSPTGNVTASNVQAAVVELDNKKAPVAFALGAGLERVSGAVRVVTGGFASRTKSADQSIPTGAWTDVPLETQAAAETITYSAPTFTIPVAGLYHVSYGIRYASNTTGYRNVRLLVGSTAGRVASTPSGSTMLTVQDSRILRLAAGSTLKMQTYHNAGAAVVMQFAEFGCYLDIAYIGA